MQNKITAVIGRKGCGKSTVVRKMIERKRRVLMFDPLSDHDFIPNTIQGDHDKLEDFLGWSVDKDTCAARYIPTGDLAQEIESFSELVFDYGDEEQHFMTVGIEEVPLFSSAGYCPPHLQSLFMQGRHRGLDLIFTGQRFAAVPRNITAMCDCFILFGSAEPRDLEELALRCGEDVKLRVAALGLHGALRFDAVSREVTRYQ